MGRLFVWGVCLLVVVSAGARAEDVIQSTDIPLTPDTAGCTVPSGGAQKVISGVPAYLWYHGCGPTAAGSILGYYDRNGFGNVFDAVGSDVLLTANVQDQISSPAHNAKYDPSPDDPDLPVPPNTSIACWFQTSVNMQLGWSKLSRADDAFMGYVGYRGYQCDSWNETYGSSFIWDDLVAEIDADRPMMFLIDTDGNGGTDHFVPVFGYNDAGESGKFYACYTTWSEDETVVWHEFRGMGEPWGVGYATFAHVTPEPASLLLLALGGVGLLRRRRRK